MATPDILAMSDSCRLAEWSTRLKSYPPNTKPPAGSTGHRVDHYVRVLKSRWVYPLIQRTAVGGGFQVPFEAFVDEEGVAWFAEGSKPPTVPIPERKDPRDGLSDTHLHFPMTDSEGYALSIRLLFSPFRLPSKAVRMLDDEKFMKTIITTMMPLWSWKEGEDEDSPVHSRDGYSLNVEPLWKKPAGESTPVQVWVGSDPFAIAERRSNLYVRQRREYADLFEPTGGERRKEVARIMLGQALNEAILEPPEAKSRYGKYLDISRMNKEIGAFEKRQTEMRKAFEKSGTSLSNHLLSPMFSLLQYASLEEEGFDDGEFHDAALEHLHVLQTVLRALDKCKAGMELLYKWASESEESSHHFINRVVLPQSQLPIHLFRTGRWSSKTALSVLKVFAPRLAATRSKFLQKLTLGLVNLGVADAAKVKEAVEAVKMKVGDIAGAVDLEGKASEVLEVEIFGKKMLGHLEGFLKYDNDNWRRLAKEYTKPAFLAVAVLDVFNVVLAWDAYRDAKGPEAVLKAGAGLAAASGFFLVSVAKPAVEIFMKEGIGKTSALRALHLTNAVCGYIYCGLNVVNALDALDQDDKDRAAALALAAAAEFVVASVYLSMLFNPAAAAPPYLLAVTVAAAIAYISATLLQDDPLEEFLEQCEWGRDAYDDSDYHPFWALARVADWKGDYNVQARMMLRLLTRLTITWDLESWPEADVAINFRQPGMRLKTFYWAVFEDGSKDVLDKRVFDEDSLPTKAPLAIKTNPKVPYTSLPGIHRVWLTVVFRAHTTAQEETLRVLIMDDGKGITSGKRSFLDK